MIDLLVSLSIWDGLYGVLSAMMQPLYWVISGLVVFFHWVFTPVFGADSGVTWTLAIVSLTLMVRTLMIPLFVKQINSTRSMQLLQPQIQALRDKYPGDQQRQGMELQKLYREEGINPAASCFPMLLQLPVFWALFRVLQGVADGQIRGYFFITNPHLVTSLQQAEFLGAGLAARVFPLTPFGATQILGIILVVLMILTLVLTQLQNMGKNMPPEALTGQMAQMQKMMLWMFPIMYAFSSAILPIGVLIYWFTSNVWTLVQQGLLIYNNPAPNTPAFLDWEDRMIAKGKDPKALYEERLAKRRKTRRVNPTPTVDVPVDEKGRRKVVRQQVNRSTIKTEETSSSQPSTRTTGVRRQPRHTSRAVRKKK